MLLAIDNNGWTFIHLAADLRELEIFEGIFNWSKGNLTSEEVNKLFLATNNDGRNVFNMAADFCELEVFQGIFNCAKGYLTSEEVNKFLLAIK